MFYKGLFPDLREAMSTVAARARQDGVWARDRTTAEFDVEGLKSLAEEHVILPKLFRRLAEYLQSGGSVAGFDEFLERRAEEIIVIPSVHATHSDTLAEVEGGDGEDDRTSRGPDLRGLTRPPCSDLMI